MATLRYINNSRTGEPGTLVELDSPLQFYDDDSYIYCASAGALSVIGGTSLALTATTITLTGAVTFTGNLVPTGNLTLTGFFDMGTADVGIVTADANLHAMEVHTEPAVAFSDYKSTFGIRSRYHISTAQTKIITVEAVDARMRVKAALTQGIYAGVQGYVEVSDSPILNATQIHAGGFTVEVGAGTTLSGGYVCGVHIDSATADTVSVASVTYAALRISTGTSSKEAWTYGIYMADNDAVTGIQMGICTTGVKMTGVTGYAIQVVTDGRAIFGTVDDGLPLADSEHGLAVHCEPSAAFTAYTSSFGIRSRYHVSVAQTNIVTYEAVDARLRVKANMAGGVHAGIQGYVEIDSSPTLTTGMTQAGGFTVEAGAGTVLTSGYLYGVHIDSATADSVDVSNVSYTALRISTGTSSKEAWTYGIYVGDADAVTGLHIGTCTTTGIQCNAKIITGVDGTGYDVKFYSATTGTYMLWDESNETLDIVSKLAVATGTTSEDAVKVTVTDASTISGNINRGLHIDYTSSGAKTGTAQINAIGFDATVSANCPDVMLVAGYLATIADKTIGNLYGVSLYFEDFGNAVSEFCMLDLGYNSPHAPAGRNCFIRARQHNTVQAGSYLARLEGGNAVSHLLYFDTGTGTNCLQSTGCTIATGDTPYIKIKVQSTEYGIPLIAI